MISQAHYLALDTNEKSKMLNEYYKNLVPYISGMIRAVYFFCLRSVFWPVFWVRFQSHSSTFNSVISFPAAIAWFYS